MKIKCEICKKIVHKRLGAKYCSNPCKFKAWVKRQIKKAK